MAVLSVKDLTKKFRKKGGMFTAVDNISFELKEGEILGVLGPNGAGKTTTIQMLLGALTPTSGEVRYFGEDLAGHREEILEKVNFSSTYTNLPWRLSVKENLTFISYLYAIPDRKKRLDKLVRIFQLEDLMDQEMTKLSSGQMTRVNMAKAFINFPRVLLLDEPTASLDPDTADYIRKFLLNERKEFNVSIIFTSHNMPEVEEVCDRILFINHGKIVADGTPDELAKTVDVSHVELVVKDGLKRTEEYCRENNHPYRVDKRSIVVDVKESDIAEFLRQLNAKGVFYDEISIEKPSLEDYFLAMARKKL